MATIYKRNSTYLGAVPVAREGGWAIRHTTSKATAQQFLGQLLDEHRPLDRSCASSSE
jgi:hypothetical protein